MRKRAERTLKELYDLTERISTPKITPVLLGSCRIQGPVDDLDILIQVSHSDEKKNLFPINRTPMRGEAGKCTVCSAPCSLCMHYKSESGFSYNLSNRTEADSSSVINVDEMPILKSRVHDELHHAASETSNLLSTSSSHDSYSENAKRKTNLRASEAYDASDVVDMPQVLLSGNIVEEEKHCKRNLDPDQFKQHSDTHLSHRFLTGKGDSQSGLECHDDNILCTSGAGDSNVVVCDSIVDIEENDMGYRNMSIISSSVVKNKIIPAEAGDDIQSHEADVNSSFIKGESMVKEGNMNLQPQAEISRCAEVDTNDFSLASLTSGNSPENETSTFPKHEVSTAIRIKGDGAVSTAAKGEDQNLETAVNVGETEVALDDVKVCDICGDAGREDLLAICSRCSDGAEHTYCMQEMLDKVPEGEWLCEECKIKETENQNVDESEAVSQRLKSTSLIDVNQNSTSTLIPKQAHKLDTRSTDLDARGSAKGLQGALVKRQIDHLEERKASELSGALIETSLRKKSILSRQISSKSQDTGKVKAAITETSFEAQPTKGSDTLSRPKTYSCSSSFKGLTPLYSPRGQFSRSASFNNSNFNPNIKTFIENAPPKQKSTRDPTTIELRKDSLLKSSAKSTFRSKTSGFSNTESAIKNSSLQQSRIEDLRTLKEVKERITVDKKIFSANPSIRSSAAIASNYSLKADAKSLQLQSDGKLNSSSETYICNSIEGLDADDLGSNEREKQVSCLFKSIEPSNCNVDHSKKSKVDKEGIRRSISAVDGSHRKFEITSSHSAVQSLESGYIGSRTRDSTASTGSRLSALGGNKTFHSQRVNETGHAIHQSSVDKLGGYAHKTSTEQKLKVVDKKVNKWREVVNAAMSKSVQKCDKLDAPEELPAATSDMICEAASKHTPSALNQRSFFIERKNGNFSSKDSAEVVTNTLASIGSVRSDALSVESSYKASSIRDTPTTAKLSAKSLAETMPDETPLLANPINGSAVPKPSLLACPPSVSEVLKTPLFANTLSGTAVPKLECIWQGSFNVIGTGSPPKMFFGIQAHLSNCASHVVFQVATKVPGNIQLEEVSHISSCPWQFLRAGPQEENIALFFFAKDIESYEKSYRKLMDKMHRNDLALRGNIDGAELLIFTSNKLPMNSQRWNKMHYLWGMFRGKKRYCLPVMGDKKSFLSNQDFSVPPIADVSNTQNLETSLKLKKLSDSTASKGMPGESINDVDLQTISSYIDKAGREPVASPVQNMLNQIPADPLVSQEHPSFPIGSSSGTKTEPLRSIVDTPNLSLQISTTKPCSEVKFFEKNDGTYQGKIISDCTAGKAGDSIALTYENDVESRLSSVRKASSVPSGSSNCTKGLDGFYIEESHGEKETSPAIIDDDQRGNVFGADLVSCESTSNRKRGRSCSVETMLQPTSCEMSKSASETALSRENPSWFPVEDQKEHKKNCFPNATSIVKDNANAARSSSKVHPLQSSILRHWQPGESICSVTSISQNTSTTERCFFPIDLNPVQNRKSANIIEITSSDDDTPESSSPDLELALGGKSKSTKPFGLPSLFPSLDGGKQQRQPSPTGDGDDAAASLSLSLFSFPATD